MFQVPSWFKLVSSWRPYLNYWHVFFSLKERKDTVREGLRYGMSVNCVVSDRLRRNQTPGGGKRVRGKVNEYLVL